MPEGQIGSASEKSSRFPTCRPIRRTRDERCEEVYRIQVQGLATRMRATGSKKLVIGVSGGLDSTQALLVCARAMDELGLPRENILAYTMPGFATSTPHQEPGLAADARGGRHAPRRSTSGPRACRC